MTPTLIVVVNEIGTEKMTYKPALMSYKSFRILENDNPTYPAPNIPDGEHRAYLQPQWKGVDNRWRDEESIEDYQKSGELEFPTRQIWKLSEEQQPEGETPIIKRLENLESVVANLTSLVNELAIAVRKRLEKPTT